MSYHGRRDYEAWLGDPRYQPATSEDQRRALDVFGYADYAGVILADPPWRYEVWSRDTGLGRSAESHYPTMTPGDLKVLPVRGLAKPDCALLMWVTWPTIEQAFELGKAWGFTFTTCAFTWVKKTKSGQHWFMGMGHYTRANPEPCLLFTRGRTVRKRKDIPQLQIACIGKHSEKPLHIHDLIEGLFDGPYVELFACQRKPGWVAWGNEAPTESTPWPQMFPGFEDVTSFRSELT